MLPVSIQDGNAEVELLGEGLRTRIYIGIDDSHERCFIVAWKPSKEDIEAIKKGGIIGVKVLGTVLPPMGLYTVNEKGEPNHEGTETTSA